MQTINKWMGRCILVVLKSRNMTSNGLHGYFFSHQFSLTSSNALVSLLTIKLYLSGIWPQTTSYGWRVSLESEFFVIHQDLLKWSSQLVFIARRGTISFTPQFPCYLKTYRLDFSVHGQIVWKCSTPSDQAVSHFHIGSDHSMWKCFMNMMSCSYC